MKNKKWFILIIIGIIFICLAFLLLLYNKYEDEKAGQASQEALEIIEENLEATSLTEEVINIEGNDYIGIINIPTLNLKLPVMSECTDKKMKLSPCRYYGSVQTNNFVICAHSYKNLFRYIKNLKSKEIVIYKDTLGNEYLYEVELIEILAPEEIEEMLESEFDLTLYTCTNDIQNRVTVRLNLLTE